MEAKPLQIVPSSHNTTTGGGPQKKIDEGENVVVVKEEKEESPLITQVQRRELDHQVFIFNHFAYNLPLPYYLLQFPSNMSEFGRLGSHHVTMVDTEPHRCKRTDGKKWRCGKNTVPNQKYCERHMHRGRNRSRKLVETSQINSPNLRTKPSIGDKSHAKLVPNIESAVSNPNPFVIQHSDTFSYTPSRSFCIVNTTSACDRSRKVIGSDVSVVTAPCSVLASAVAPKITTFSSMMASHTSDDRSRLNACKQDEQIKMSINDNMSIKSGTKGSNSCEINSISTGIGISPKSVLQVSGCNYSYLNDRNSIPIETEPGRCRRTDGKNWRCKSAVLPGQKYCATHMHRGAKRRCINHEPPPPPAAAAVVDTTTTTTIGSSVTIALVPYPSVKTSTDIQKAYCQIPNTKLSMSVPDSAPFVECNEKNGGNSDTETSTTITDTINDYLSF
ncbi:growth-regulating factor 9-like [Trifolium pratense]|uniref:growth-regulating factor 9-like n=1 Tax=Trifolium pratense TaxID=57577 RepID=UPI001E697AA7|nr:growth-regulating factor 9-like [Trifolium pratense]